MSAGVIVPDEIYPPQTSEAADNKTLAVTEVRDVKGRFGAGNRPRNPGGRPKKLREIEKMLNTEFRNVDAMREVFTRLRALAMGEVVLVPVLTDAGTVQVQARIEADARYMQLFLDRTMGPAKAFEDDFDLSDAPSEVIEYLRVRVQR